MLCFVLKDNDLGYYTSEGVYSENLLDAKFFKDEVVANTRCEELNQDAMDNDNADSRMGRKPDFVHFEVKKFCLLGDTL